MKRKINMIKKMLSSEKRALWNYRHWWKNERIDDHLILLESQQGRSPFGNVYYIAKELANNPEYKQFKLVYVSLERNKEFVNKVVKKISNKIEVVNRDSHEYVKLLAISKYLITDTGFPAYYTKKSGQILWNTWHGTPLKAMGRRDVANPHNLGNIQKNFFLADYLLFPNRHTAKHMIDDYMLNNICDATILYADYPRNEVFIRGGREDLRSVYSQGATKVLAYMPTWRSYPDISRKALSYELAGLLSQIDRALDDNEIMYVSIHPLHSGYIDFSAFKRIKKFPSDCETYDFLSICDILITDYSSVMFDFAITRKKIVLFDYDIESYSATRGLYLEMDDLPFPRVSDLQGLFEEIRSEKQYCDDAFVQEYCPFCIEGTTSKLCKRVILNSATGITEEKIVPNKKDNILIYAGNLAMNGITKSLLNLSHAVDCSKYNYYLTFDARMVSKNKEVLLQIPNEIAYIPSVGKKNLSLIEKIVQYLFHKKKISFNRAFRYLKNAYSEDIERNYGSIKFSTVIHFTGYDYKRIFQFSLFSCKRVLFFHSNMTFETKEKSNSRNEIIRYAMETYDQIAVVSDDLKKVMSAEYIDYEEKLFVVPNVFDYQTVRNKSSLNFSFDSNTQSSQSYNYLMEMINNADNKVIISIGRFSPEKQHLLLLKAFNKVWLRHRNAVLLIVGGYSYKNMYADTCEFVETLPCKNNIALIKSLTNPYPLIESSCGLILSSKYEGFGLVLLEADAIGKPVVSTNVCGPSTFMNQHGGTLVENSESGLINGLSKLLEGKVKVMNIDYDRYNREAVEAFYSILL